LERAKTSADENMLLRRELSKLASQILTVARAQGMGQVQQPRMVVEVTQAYIEPSAINALQAPQEEPEQEEQRQPAHAGNGATHEPEMPEMEDAAPEVDAMAAGMGRAGAETDGEPEDAAEEDADSEEAKGSFARRFVARREA